MRKSAWIAVVLIVLVVLLVVAPAIAGIYFKHSYTKLMSTMNIQDNVSIRVLRYERGWFSSDVTIALNVNNPAYFKFIQRLGLPIDAIPTQYLFTQHISHGPIMYHPVNGMDSLIGIATINNQLTMTPSVKHFLTLLGVNPPTSFIEFDRDFVGLSGAIYKHVKLNSSDMVYPATRIHIKQANSEARIWIYPMEKRIAGDVTLKQVIVTDSESSIQLPDLSLQLNVYQSPSQLWLGSVGLLIPEMTWTDDGVRVFSMSGLDFSGSIDELNGLVSGSRSFAIQKMNINDRSLGPMQLQISAKHIKAQALADLLDAYRQITLRGELYKSQLQKKIYSLLPTLVTPETQLALDALKITTQYGNLTMNGELHWAIDQAAMSDDLLELLQSANAELDLRFAKRLGEEFITVASKLPFFNSVGPSLSEVYWSMRQQLYFSERQNAFTLAGLVDSNLISENEALNLLQLQRRSVPYDQYASQVKKLLLDKEITRETSYALAWQYQQVDMFAEQIEKLTTNNQTAVANDMHSQLTEWIKAGYLKPVDNDYVVSVIQHQGNYKINGHSL